MKKNKTPPNPKDPKDPKDPSTPNPGSGNTVPKEPTQIIITAADVAFKDTDFGKTIIAGASFVGFLLVTGILIYLFLGKKAFYKYMSKQTGFSEEEVSSVTEDIVKLKNGEMSWTEIAKKYTPSIAKKSPAAIRDFLQGTAEVMFSMAPESVQGMFNGSWEMAQNMADRARRYIPELIYGTKLPQDIVNFMSNLDPTQIESYTITKFLENEQVLEYYQNLVDPKLRKEFLEKILKSPREMIQSTMEKIKSIPTTYNDFHSAAMDAVGLTAFINYAISEVLSGQGADLGDYLLRQTEGIDPMQRAEIPNLDPTQSILQIAENMNKAVKIEMDAEHIPFTKKISNFIYENIISKVAKKFNITYSQAESLPANKSVNDFKDEFQNSKPGKKPYDPDYDLDPEPPEKITIDPIEFKPEIGLGVYQNKQKRKKKYGYGDPSKKDDISDPSRVPIDVDYKIAPGFDFDLTQPDPNKAPLPWMRPKDEISLSRVAINELKGVDDTFNPDTNWAPHHFTRDQIDAEKKRIREQWDKELAIEKEREKQALIAQKKNPGKKEWIFDPDGQSADPFFGKLIDFGKSFTQDNSKDLYIFHPPVKETSPEKILKEQTRDAKEMYFSQMALRYPNTSDIPVMTPDQLKEYTQKVQTQRQKNFDYALAKLSYSDPDKYVDILADWSRAKYGWGEKVSVGNYQMQLLLRNINGNGVAIEGGLSVPKLVEIVLDFFNSAAFIASMFVGGPLVISGLILVQSMVEPHVVPLLNEAVENSAAKYPTMYPDGVVVALQPPGWVWDGETNPFGNPPKWENI